MLRLLRILRLVVLLRKGQSTDRRKKQNRGVLNFSSPVRQAGLAGSVSRGRVSCRLSREDLRPFPYQPRIEPSKLLRRTLLRSHVKNR